MRTPEPPLLRLDQTEPRPSRSPQTRAPLSPPLTFPPLLVGPFACSTCRSRLALLTLAPPARSSTCSTSSMVSSPFSAPESPRPARSATLRVWIPARVRALRASLLSYRRASLFPPPRASWWIADELQRCAQDVRWLRHCRFWSEVSRRVRVVLFEVLVLARPSTALSECVLFLLVPFPLVSIADSPCSQIFHRSDISVEQRARTKRASVATKGERGFRFLRLCSCQRCEFFCIESSTREYEARREKPVRERERK